MKIFQLYFKPEQVPHLDPAFEPFDNTDNPRPELREWDVWDRVYEQCCEQNLDYWGFLSWKFKQKSNLEGQQVIDWINANPGYDVYFINPSPLSEAVFVNSWEQGDVYHPNISSIGNSFLKKMGYDDVNVLELLLDRNVTGYANYVIGSREFWDKFMTFSRALFTEAEKDPTFKHQVFGQGLSNYAHDKTLPNFTFLIERLIPTFIELQGMRSLPFPYSVDTLKEHYRPYLRDMQALSNLKVLINRYECDDLYYIWDYYRQKFLQEHPGILNLE